MSEPTQTVAAVPSTYASRYAKYNPSSQFQMKPWHKLFVFCVGLPKTGKSTIFESNPDGLRLDLDRAGNSNPNPKCISLPALNDGTGRPIIVTKQLVDDVVAQLVADAKANLPRPKNVAFDTVDKLVDILCTEYAAARGVRSFYELESKHWGAIYQMVRDYCTTLTQAGYGVWLMSHVVNKSVEISDRRQMQLDLTMKDTLYASLLGSFDLIVAVDRGQEITKREEFAINPVTKETIMVNGKPKVARIVDERSDFVDLLFHQTKPEDPFALNYSRLLCRRAAGLPDKIRLPRVGSWGILEETYNKAALADGATLIS